VFTVFTICITVTEAAFAQLLEDSVVGFGAGPFADTRRSRRFWAGDAEVAARYRLAAGANYAATVGLLVRLPTGHQDSPHNFLDLATGDHQTDIEGQLVQELVVGGRLWLNLAVRGDFGYSPYRRRDVGGLLLLRRRVQGSARLARRRLHRDQLLAARQLP